MTNNGGRKSMGIFALLCGVLLMVTGLLVSPGSAAAQTTRTKRITCPTPTGPVPDPCASPTPGASASAAARLALSAAGRWQKSPALSIGSPANRIEGQLAETT